VFSFTDLVCAQAFRASLVGIVPDASGAVIPNADVTVINTPRTPVPMITTDGKGAFAMSHLLPGTYTMRVGAQGFKKSTATTASARYASGNLLPGEYGVVIAMTGFRTFVRALLGRSVARTFLVRWVAERISVSSVALVSGHALLAGAPSPLACAVLARSRIGRVR